MQIMSLFVKVVADVLPIPWHRIVHCTAERLSAEGQLFCIRQSMKFLMAAAISSVVGDGDNNFPTLLSTISAVPPTAVAITGIPAEKASMIDTGTPSDSLVLMNKSVGCRR